MTDDEIMEEIVLTTSKHQCGEIETDEALDDIERIMKERE
jgi:hypothetical protein